MTNIKKTDSTIDHLLKNSPNLIFGLKEGEVVEANLLKRTPKAAFFDLGKFGTGIVYRQEIFNAKEIFRHLEEGAPISAKVVSIENEDGYVELSLSEAGRQKTWQKLKEFEEKGEEIKIKIIAANSGGLIAEIEGIKAFLPVSQLSTEHYPRVNDGSKEKILEELKKFVEQELSVKVIDINPRNNKLIVSEKEISRQDISESLSKYAVGDIIDGIISGVASFGAFIRFTDNPQIEGLIHISELSHKLIENPKEIIKINDNVKVKIVEIKEGRVNLSLKSLQPNPWDKVKEKYITDQEIDGTVTKFNPFGAFIALDSEIQGIIHISEFSGNVEEMKSKLELEKSYVFKIDSVKPEEKRIILKLK
jgi:small subunit ribosomal protein S1